MKLWVVYARNSREAFGHAYFINELLAQNYYEAQEYGTALYDWHMDEIETED